MVEEFDVVVIGAGFAGLSAAINAGECDASVLVLESGDKIDGSCCAGGLPSFAIERMGLMPDEEYIKNVIKTIKILLPDNSPLYLKMKYLQGLIIDKTQLTNILADKALNVGAKIRFQSRVIKYDSKKGTVCVADESKNCSYFVRAEVIIDASGCDTHLARDAGLVERLDKKDICLCAQYIVKHKDIAKDEMIMWVDQTKTPGGYIWLFPTEKGIARIGCGVCDHSHNPKKIVDDFIKNNYPDAEKFDYIAATIPLAEPLEHVVFDRVLLVGDRANYVMAISGAGNALAWESGKIAGDVAARFVAKGILSMQEYEDTMKKQYYKQLHNSYMLKSKLLNGGNKYVYKIYRMVKPFLWLHRIFPRWVEMKAGKNLRMT